VVVFVKGKTLPVMVDNAMAVGGWPGGQGVQWIDSPTSDTFKVTYSDGPLGGFLLWGSNETSDQFISYTGNQPGYKFGVLCVGAGWVFSTSSFERYTWLSRQGGPLVLNVYVPGQKLRFSLRGLFTNEDEWTASLDPRAPNDWIVGTVISIPSSVTNNYLTLRRG
jgi:hypothetical protein